MTPPKFWWSPTAGLIRGPDNGGHEDAVQLIPVSAPGAGAVRDGADDEVARPVRRRDLAALSQGIAHLPCACGDDEACEPHRLLDVLLPSSPAPSVAAPSREDEDEAIAAADECRRIEELWMAARPDADDAPEGQCPGLTLGGVGWIVIQDPLGNAEHWLRRLAAAPRTVHDPERET